MIGYNVACTKDDNETKDSVKYGTVRGSVSCVMGSSGFKITLTHANGKEQVQVIVTGQDGVFCFTDVVPGNYIIEANKEGFDCDYIAINGTIKYNKSSEIQVVSNETTDVTFRMMPNSSYMNSELTITDAYGNPIGNSITISKYMPTISIKLLNETNKDISWSLQSQCYLQGARDTVIGGYSGFVGYDMYYIFSNISPTNGTLSPGENVLIVGTINENIYALDRFSSQQTTLSLFIQGNVTSKRKDIELDLPFVELSDMSTWYHW